MKCFCVSGARVAVDCVDDDVHFEDLPEESDFVEELFLNFGDGINSMTFDGLIPEMKLQR